MEIVVNGSASIKVRPNVAVLHLNFSSVQKTVESAVEEGSKMVYELFNILSNKYGFTKGDFITGNLSVTKNTRYDNATNSFIDEGYIFNQDVELKFDYDLSLLAMLIEEISKFGYPVNYSISFEIEDIDKYRNSLLNDAYQNALVQAEIIASSADKQIIGTSKVEVEDYSNIIPFSNRIHTVSNDTVSQRIEETFTPSDILIERRVNVVFLAN